MVVLQGTLGAWLTVAGAHPDLMLALVVVASLTGGSSRGAIIGFALGLLSDLFLDTPFGLSALTDVLVGYGVGMLSTEADAAWWLRPLIAGGASAIAVALYAGLGAIVGQTQMLSPGLWKVALVVGGFNAILAIPLWRPVRWAFPAKREEMVSRLWR